MMQKKIGQILKNWKFFSFDWSSIDRMPIESGKFKPKFLSQFQSVEKHPRSIKNLENSNFWKTEQFYVETLQSTIFHEWMHEYEIKSFLKTFEFNPDLPKTRFLIIKNTICVKIKEHILLDGHNKITHNIMYQV